MLQGSGTARSTTDLMPLYSAVWQLKYILDIRSFVFTIPCEDGTLVVKHIVVDM
jgi:hypothetical protein